MGIVLTEKYHMDIGRNIRNEGAFADYTFLNFTCWIKQYRVFLFT